MNTGHAASADYITTSESEIDVASARIDQKKIDT